MTTSTHSPDRLSWTALGQRMGFTSQRPQRDEILTAIDRMHWVETTTRPTCLDSSVMSSVVRAVVTAVLRHRCDQLRSIVQVGSAQLNGGRQLIGVEDTLGTRSYVLDLDAEAIYVLAEFRHPLPAAASHPTAHVA